ncbi:MAG: hypothetical protein ACRDF5_12190 [bacterium]
MMLRRPIRRNEGGFALILVLITSLLMGLIGLGVFSVVMSDVHGAIANQLAMQAVNTAEAGVDYAVSEMFALAQIGTTDASYGGPGGSLPFGPGTFQVVVRCEDGSIPGPTDPQCPGDNNVRHIISTGLVGRARRQIQVWVRRTPPGGDTFSTFCGRRGVTLDQGTTVAADVASNRDIAIEGPRRNPGTIQAKDAFLAAPPDPAAFAPIPIAPAPLALTGSYSWKVTYVDSTGAESTGGPETAPVALTNQNAALSAVPVGGASIVKRRIYRTRADQAGSGPWFFVGEIADNLTSTYLDTTVDAELIFPTPGPGSVSAPPTGPTAAADAAAPAQPLGLTGSYTYQVSYVYRYQGTTTAEIESVGSNPATPDPPSLLLTDQYVKLTNIPQSTDPAVLKRRIYRSRADVPGGPWFFVAEIAASNNDLDDLDPDVSVVERGYVDKTADADLVTPAPRAIAGNAFAGGDVSCSQGCPNQVDGEVRENVREVLCAPFIPPPCTPDTDPNNDAPLLITHSNAEPLVKVLQYDEVHPLAAQRLTIETPDNPNAELHIHATDVIFERDVVMAVRGRGRVYFHVARTFRLGQRSWFGVNDEIPGSLLVWPGDRMQILSCASDPDYLLTGTASVRWDQQNRVSALVFAPRANILINQAGEFLGALVGQYIHINQGLGYVLDPGSGFSEGLLRSAFQIVDRWYDNPRF